MIILVSNINPKAYFLATNYIYHVIIDHVNDNQTFEGQYK